MGKTKHNPPGKSEPTFIKFSKVQRAYIEEVLKRQRDEFNEIIDMIYDELGITEKILKAPPGTYNLRKDCSGLDVIPIKPNEKDN